MAVLSLFSWLAVLYGGRMLPFIGHAFWSLTETPSGVRGICDGRCFPGSNRRGGVRPRPHRL